MAENETTEKPAKDDPDRMVEVIVTRFTSVAQQFLAPGRHRLRLLHAKHLQAQGLGHPPTRAVDAVKAVPDEPADDAEGIDDEDKGSGSEDE